MPPEAPPRDTRQLILRAAQDVIEELGYRHATTRAIAERAGCAEGSIYRYFDDKRSLCTELVGTRYSGFIQMMSTLPERAGTSTVRRNLDRDAREKWQKRDAGLLGFFANQVLDAAERERAWQRYYKIRDFAELDKCRHRQICLHFGETPKWSSCNACDVCGEMPDWLSVAATPKAVRKAVRSSPAPVRANEATSAADRDPELREYLREWRRMMAKEQGLPAYTVLHDTTLDEICRIRPSSIAQLRTITGIGERKAESIGLLILRALEEYRTGARAAQLQASTPPMQETLELLKSGKSFEEICVIRGRQISTVMSTVAALVETGELDFSPAWLSPEKVSVIEAACTRLQTDGYQRLRPLKEILPPDITYSEIRLVVARLRRQSSQNSPQPTT